MGRKPQSGEDEAHKNVVEKRLCYGNKELQMAGIFGASVC